MSGGWHVHDVDALHHYVFPPEDAITPKEAGDEAMAAMGPMLAEIRAVMYLPDDNPRRQAAMAEKRRVLALIERSNGRRRFP
jgi:uncharacterized protein YbjT (DUF2867 family)